MISTDCATTAIMVTIDEDPGSLTQGSFSGTDKFFENWLRSKTDQKSALEAKCREQKTDNYIHARCKFHIFKLI